MNENTKLKEWYTTNYPDDELGDEINPDSTFQNLFDALDQYRDVYEVIGVGDSLVRERLFESLADVTHYDYDTIYNQWLMA